MNRSKGAGFTLTEVLVASAIGAVVAGGSMIAYVAAARMMRAPGVPSADEAVVYARETLETYRNMIACDSPWFVAATCAPVLGPPMDGNWIADPWLPPPPRPGVESILNTSTPKRCYRVIKRDCDGDGTDGDCFNVDAQVCWNGTACPC